MSYDRFLSVSSHEKTNSVIERYERKGESYSEVTPMALPVGDLNAPEVPQY